MTNLIEMAKLIPEPPNYKKGVKSRALVASDGRGIICLAKIGPHLDYWLDEVGETEQITFEGAPVGITIWEGKIRSWRTYDGDYDCELEGDFRPLTEEEWEDYRTNGEAWDSSEWFEGPQDGS